jgi:hypothetical protein
MKYLLSFAILFILICPVYSQIGPGFFMPPHPNLLVKPDSVWEREGMEKLMGLMNLQFSDLTFRDDYTKKDSFRLAAVANLMRRPYGMIAFTESAAALAHQERPEPILTFAFDNLAREDQSFRGEWIDKSLGKETERGINLFYQSPELNRILKKAYRYLYNIFPPSSDSTFALLSSPEKKFLLNEFKQNLMEDTADESRSVDVLDSLSKVEEEYIKQFIKFGLKIRKDFIISAGSQAAIEFYREIALLQEEIKNDRFDINKALADTVELPSRIDRNKFLGKGKGWAIGGPGEDTYRGDYYFILDLGGNDRYELTYNPENPHGVIIIDLSGNDIYNGNTDFTIGSGCMSAGLLFDMAGDDIYNGRNFSCGSGYFGFGFLYDRSGFDKYYGDIHTTAAGTFGLGILLDAGGCDLYSAALYSQGFAGPEGMGLLIDYKGNDNYIAGNKYKDVLRYSDHYLSLSQGFSYGFRPYLSGGIGAIIDYEGNDSYLSDIFAQGTSYWWALGFIYDSSGNDQYISYQYAQGAATHMALGILLDETGNDIYFGKGLMQGCGHDYSCGILLDRNGNDIYHAYDLSQAAGSANGFGILIDDRGDDAYYIMRKNNTQGFGDARRDFGSLGLFLDLGGVDRYDGNGADNSYWKTPSKWGGGMNIDFIPKPDSISGVKR